MTQTAKCDVGAVLCSNNSEGSTSSYLVCLYDLWLTGCFSLRTDGHRVMQQSIKITSKVNPHHAEQMLTAIRLNTEFC